MASLRATPEGYAGDIARVRASVVLERPPHDALALVADLANDPVWRPSVLEVELVEGRPGHPGAVYRERIRVGGAEVASEAEVLERDAVAVRFRVRSPVAAVGGYRARAHDEGCRLEFELDLEPQGGLMALAQGMIAGRVQGAIEEDLARLRGMIERAEI